MNFKKVLSVVFVLVLVLIVCNEEKKVEIV